MRDKSRSHLAGYSGKPLAAKLGLKAGAAIAVIAAPANYRKLLGRVPAGVTFSTPDAQPDSISLFLHGTRPPRERPAGPPSQDARRRSSLGILAKKKRCRPDHRHRRYRPGNRAPARPGRQQGVRGGRHLVGIAPGGAIDQSPSRLTIRGRGVRSGIRGPVKRGFR